MNPAQIIVFAAPVFLALIALEFAWGCWRGRNTYRFEDAVTSIGLGMLSQFSAVFTRMLRVGIYTAVYSHVALLRADDFWMQPVGWLLALLFYDFCYYWLHRAGHEVALFWAAHVVHHQSEDYNLSTALRQTSSGALFGWVFYLPMALAGVPPLVFGVVALVDLLYQFWVHTEHVGKLGAFDRWFCSPSNHRVHHATNDEYLDRNYGGILVVWDRLFGSFAEERTPCVYGTRNPLDSWDPLWANAEVYAQLLRDSWQARDWRDKLRVWIKPPGWRPPDLAARPPAPWPGARRATKFSAAPSHGVRWFAGVQFALLLLGVLRYLWIADALPLALSLTAFVLLTLQLWMVGAVLQSRMRWWQMVLVQAAIAGALLTAGA